MDRPGREAGISNEDGSMTNAFRSARRLFARPFAMRLFALAAVASLAATLASCGGSDGCSGCGYDTNPNLYAIDYGDTA